MSKVIETITEVIQRRRSVFPASYIKKEIPVEIIEQILANANYAPSHKLTQPWRFVVIRNDAKTRLGQTLGDIYKASVPSDKFLKKKYDSFGEKTEQADCILAINIQFHPDQLPAWEEIAATACAVQNVALSAEALNVGAYWSSPPLIDHLGEFLGLAENEKCYGLFYMGYHDEEPRKANREPIEDKVKWLNS